jgi:hypothetical protein
MDTVKVGRNYFVHQNASMIRSSWRGAFLLSVFAASAFLWIEAAFSAGVSQSWVNRYSNGMGSAVVIDPCGDVIVTGSSFTDLGSDFLTIKYAGTNGTLLWQHRYNGPSNSSDAAAAVALDRQANPVVAGNSYDDVDSNTAYYTAKYAAADGTLIWENRYQGTPYNSLAAMGIDGNDNVIVTGSSYDGVGITRWLTVKYSADGTFLWEKRSGGASSNACCPQRLAVDTNGDIIVTGYSFGRDYISVFYTVKYAAATGDVLWERLVGEPLTFYGEGQAVVVDRNNDVIVAGSVLSTNDWDYYTAKYAGTSGVLLWERRYNGPANGPDKIMALAIDRDDNLLVTGSSFETENSFDYYTVKYSSDGTPLWEQRYSGPGSGDDVAQAVAIDAEQNVIVTGFSTGDQQNVDYYTIKYAGSDGQVLWGQRYNGPANKNDYMRNAGATLAIGVGGLIAVTGDSNNTLDDGPDILDYATIVYREPLSPVSVAIVDGRIRVRFSGVPGRAYNLQGAVAPSGPWSTIAILTAPANGVIEYTDVSENVRVKFYRTSAL